MLIFPGSFLVHQHKIRGVHYAVFSFYTGQESVSSYLSHLIADSFDTASPDELKSSAEEDISLAIAED